jgi:hypothetical protein
MRKVVPFLFTLVHSLKESKFNHTFSIKKWLGDKRSENQLDLMFLSLICSINCTTTSFFWSVYPLSLAITLNEASCWYSETTSSSLTFCSSYLLVKASKINESYSLIKCSIISLTDLPVVNKLADWPVRIGMRSDCLSGALVWGHVPYVLQWARTVDF